MIKKYDKLIRDRIPEIIEAEGNKCTVSVLSDKEYKDKLAAKLVEEAEEFLESRSEEEMADVLEVFMAIAKAYGFKSIESIREKKKVKRGGFEKKLLLKETVIDA